MGSSVPFQKSGALPTVDHKALAALTKSGLIDYATPICPPQSDHFLPADKLLELRQFLVFNHLNGAWIRPEFAN